MKLHPSKADHIGMSLRLAASYFRDYIVLTEAKANPGNALEISLNNLKIAVNNLGFDMVPRVPRSVANPMDPDTIPAITEAPGFDGRDNSSIGGGRG